MTGQEMTGQEMTGQVEYEISDGVAWLTIKAAKRAVGLIAERPLSRAFEAAERIWAPICLSADAQEGPAAFAGRRPPVWTGR